MDEGILSIEGNSTNSIVFQKGKYQTITDRRGSEYDLELMDRFGDPAGRMVLINLGDRVVVEFTTAQGEFYVFQIEFPPHIYDVTFFP